MSVRLLDAPRAEAPLRIVAPVVVGVLALVVWQLAVDVFQVTPRMLPSPSAIAAALVTHIGIIVEDAVTTGGNALLGLVGGTLLAIAVAGLAAWSRHIDWMAAPVVAAIAVVPIVALTPLFNTMFGASSQFGRQAIAGIAAFVPVYINMLRGLRQARPVQRDLFRAYAASGGQAFLKLTLPTAVPYLVTGIRVASSVAVISALVAEYFGGPADGIGTAIATMATSGNAALAWAYVFAGIVIGLAFFLATVLVELLAARRTPV